jgi:hypothetical protein
MSQVVDQLENAEWREIPTRTAVGIPLAIGAIIIVTGASGTIIVRKVRELRAKKARREQIARNPQNHTQ